MSGSLHFDGVDVTNQSTEFLARSGVVGIPEGRAIFPGLTVDENVTMCARRAGTRRDRQTAVATVYERFPLLYERRNQTAGTLSGGESRLLALSHIFGAPPRVLVVDELSIGLSPLRVAEVYEHLAAANAAGVAVIVIEQFVENALKLAKQALILARGSMIFQGDKEILRSSPEFLDYLGPERSPE